MPSNGVLNQYTRASSRDVNSTTMPRPRRKAERNRDAMSPTVLNARLRELRDTAIVEPAEPGGYRLSATGKSLLKARLPLLKWSDEWQAVLASGDGAPG